MVKKVWLSIAANVGMRHTARDANFVLEALKQALISCSFIGQEFERHRLPQSQIICPINLTHSAFPEERDDAITASKQASRKKAAFAWVFGGSCEP
jgi:hypothetical protein